MDIRYGKAFHIFRYIGKQFLSWIYPVVVYFWPLPIVRTIQETIEEIITTRKSISRFGDGEFLYIIDKLNLPFQKYDSNLAARLVEILKSDDDNILVGLPIGYQSHENLTPNSRLTWRSQVAWIYPRLWRYLSRDKIYYNASFTRPYMSFEENPQIVSIFKGIRDIWKDRRIVIIEGEKSRLGVGNDLFSNSVSVQRILAPMHHAFTVYSILLEVCLKQEKDKIMLVALGPTATVLSFDLARCGYQAIDIGNIDIEYEWYLRGVRVKMKIPGKYTSEAKGGRDVEDIEDEEYDSQIIDRILI